MKQKRLLIFSALIFLSLVSQVIAQPVPDTGQTKCYDDKGNVIACPSAGQRFYGQDANYTINPMSYTKLDANGKALADSATSWAMVRDNVTGLVWEVKTTANKDRKYTWKQAKTYAKNLRLGKHSDWRLPTIKELAYLVDYRIPSPGPTINTRYFPNTSSWSYWSSTTHAYTTSRAWDVSFGSGSGSYTYKSWSLYVRAVRGGQSSNNFKDNDDGTVTDTSTGLMWQKATAPGTYTWEKALEYCEKDTTGNYTDWRLPTIKELRSLVDHSGYNPAINKTFFPDTKSSSYWSSTTAALDTYDAWYVIFYFGDDTDYGTYKLGSIMYVRAVRGGQAGSLGNLRVLIEPQGARDAGAQWRRTGTSTWRNSGYTEKNIPVGKHKVEFSKISGWIMPSDQSVKIEKDKTSSVKGTYTPGIEINKPAPGSIMLLLD